MLLLVGSTALQNQPDGNSSLAVGFVLLMFILVGIIFFYTLNPTDPNAQEETDHHHGHGGQDHSHPAPHGTSHSGHHQTDHSAHHQASHHTPVATVSTPPPPVVSSPAPVTPPPAPKADDLKIIEGIGPKIAQLLQEAGITTFAKLAQTDVATLNKIVREQAGITIANPASWPEQAQLAAAEKWAELETLQGQLKGGRH